MPEGDTLARTAAGLRPHLLGRAVIAARSPALGAQVDRVVGAEVTAVEALGKNLLIRLSNGLELRTHLRMHGSWHRYRPGERWRRPAARARLVLEVPGAVAVCFDAPVVELFEARAERLHPALAGLGPDLLGAGFGDAAVAEVVRRLRDPARAGLAIGEALVDQRALAGIGNIWKSETLFAERVDPFARVGDLDDPTLRRLVVTARRLLAASAGTRDTISTAGASAAATASASASGTAANGTEKEAAAAAAADDRHLPPPPDVPDASGPDSVLDPGPSRAVPSRRVRRPAAVYRRAGRPCPRCGILVRSAPQGRDVPRMTYWCPSCQRGGR